MYMYLTAVNESRVYCYYSRRHDISCWNDCSLQELQDTALALNDVMLQLHEFSNKQQSNLEESSSQQLLGLSSLEDSVKSQHKSNQTELSSLVKFLSERLQTVVERINTFQSEQEHKITSCSEKIDEICKHFKKLQAEQSQLLAALQERIQKEGGRYEELIEANKNNMLLHLSKQREFEKDETKTLCSSIEGELDQMKARLCELVRSGCVKRGDILLGRGNLLEENFEDQKTKHREEVVESVRVLEDVKERGSSSVEKLTIAKDIKLLLGEEFRTLNAAYCDGVNEKMRSLETKFEDKIGRVGDGLTSEVSLVLDGLTEQQNQVEETSQKFSEDYKSFLANNAVVAEDLDTRISDICEEFITETGERFLQEYNMMETNQQEVITSISDLNKECISSLQSLEMTHDVPTGSTPVKREVLYKKNLTRPRPQSLQLGIEREDIEEVYDQKRKCSSPTFQSTP